MHGETRTASDTGIIVVTTMAAEHDRIPTRQLPLATRRIKIGGEKEGAEPLRDFFVALLVQSRNICG
ncbi:MAG: hypothetical protein JSW21_10645 [Gammaproteobacteria bacterium]|nr:MAG: hypothetical protein JSW21_10645 [Gammaproteobacteria bacterium]